MRGVFCGKGLSDFLNLGQIWGLLRGFAGWVEEGVVEVMGIRKLVVFHLEINDLIRAPLGNVDQGRYLEQLMTSFRSEGFILLKMLVLDWLLQI